MGMGEKTQNTIKRNQGKDFPRLVALPSPRLRNGGRLFSGIRNTENKSDLPLVGEGS